MSNDHILVYILNDLGYNSEFKYARTVPLVFISNTESNELCFVATPWGSLYITEKISNCTAILSIFA